MRRTLVLLLLLALTACGGKSNAFDVTTPDDPDGLAAIVLPKPYVVPDATVTDSEDHPFDLGTDLTKPVTLVFFGYTHCPDICLVVMADIASALQWLSPEERSKVGMVFVTTDPARDDPKTLRTYLDHIDPDFEGVTAPIDQIKTIGKAFGIAIEKGDPLPSGGYDVAHSTQVVGVLPDGSAPLVWTQGFKPKAMAADLHHVLANGVPKVGSTE